jgi:hypothetical protein
MLLLNATRGRLLDDGQMQLMGRREEFGSLMQVAGRFSRPTSIFQTWWISTKRNRYRIVQQLVFLSVLSDHGLDSIKTFLLMWVGMLP